MCADKWTSCLSAHSSDILVLISLAANKNQVTLPWALEQFVTTYIILCISDDIICLS